MHFGPAILLFDARPVTYEADSLTSHGQNATEMKLDVGQRSIAAKRPKHIAWGLVDSDGIEPPTHGFSERLFNEDPAIPTRIAHFCRLLITLR